MENDGPDAATALDALDEARRLNAERLRRPRGYWPMVGGFMAVIVLIPYLSALPAVLRYLLPLALLLVVVAIAARKQPSAVRKIRLTGGMWVELIGFAVLCGVFGGVSNAAFDGLGLWWAPAVAAVAIFVIVAIGGRMLDASWARRVSRGDR